MHLRVFFSGSQPIDHSKVLLEQLSAFRLDASSADMTLFTTLDGLSFPVHKLILSLRSPVFAAMFNHRDLKENQKKQVEIDDISGEVMEALLKYIYSGDIRGITGIAGSLLSAADKVDQGNADKLNKFNSKTFNFFLSLPSTIFLFWCKSAFNRWFVILMSQMRPTLSTLPICIHLKNQKRKLVNSLLQIGLP